MWLSWSKLFVFLLQRRYYVSRHDSRQGSLAKPLYCCRRYHLTHTSLLWFLCESMNFHPDKQLFPSCRRRGSNRWPLDYKASALPLPHGGPTLADLYDSITQWPNMLLLVVCSWNHGSVSETETKVQFRYWYQSRFFFQNRNFFFQNFLQFFCFLGHISL